ncbi:hypothetical protein QMK47_28060 [Pseudomonas sp. P9_35]|uniref:hypothetical protein n=1 Tax=Pseudomonas TaxID=286 RepID=UPI0020A0ED86|nr:MULTISPECIES: hypothetical protein [Pseudomonas]MCP1453070.1 hypothetical protein [Pseudomonas kilonensis]WPN63313.1 hypothetical protein QMK48_27155 [Pseudomonas sp. P9_32]WPN69066.1 hypothetical protein QMK47_28060 [Pseudomonas sp. P9_35]
MSELMEYVFQKVTDAELVGEPFKFFEVKDFVPAGFYKEFISSLPVLDLYKPLMHKSTLRNGSSTRFELPLSLEGVSVDLGNVFSGSKVAIDIVELLCGEQFKRLLLDKFGSDFEVTPYPHLYKDFAGFDLPPHTDIVEKAMTFGWYLPESTEHKNSGLGLFVRSNGGFDEFRRIPYEPNVAFAFLRSNDSWHGAKHHPSVSYERNSLFVTFYLKNHYRDGALFVNDPNVDRKEIRIRE